MLLIVQACFCRILLIQVVFLKLKCLPKWNFQVPRFLLAFWLIECRFKRVLLVDTVPSTSRQHWESLLVTNDCTPV